MSRTGGGRGSRKRGRKKRAAAGDLVGKQVRLLVEVHTQGSRVYQSGAVFLVDGTWRGKFSLVGPAGHIRHCPRERFEVIEDGS